MTGDEVAVPACVGLEVAAFGVLGAASDQRVFYEHGYDLGETDRFLFRVCETCYFSPFHDVVTVFVLGVDESDGSMADGGYGFVVRPEIFDQANGDLVVDEIPKRAVASGEENRVEVVGRERGQLDGGGQCGVCGAVGLEAAGRGGLSVGLVTLGVERRLPALGGKPM